MNRVWHVEKPSKYKHYGILDSGAVHTVAGRDWIATLPWSTCHKMRTVKTENVYRFGPGEPVKALYSVFIPVSIGGLDGELNIDVVDADVPLLLSQSAMAALNMSLEFQKEETIIKVDKHKKQIPQKNCS